MRRAQRGFATVSLLVLLPLLLAIAAVISAATLVMKNEGEALHLCRTELLKAQEQVQSKLERLLKLNPRAERLRNARTRAEHLVRVAPGPIAKAAAVAKLNIVIAQQLLLASEQRTLITSAKAISRLTPDTVSLKIRRQLLQSQSVQVDGVRNSFRFRSTTQAAGFDLVAHPLVSLTPNYKPSSSFTQKQTMSVEVAVGALDMLPGWIFKLISSEPLSRNQLTLRFKCASTIEAATNEKSRIKKGRAGWLAKLKTDKSWLN